jgi:hypothetical protein
MFFYCVATAEELIATVYPVRLAPFFIALPLRTAFFYVSIKNRVSGLTGGRTGLIS